MEGKTLFDDFPISIPIDQSASHCYLKSNEMFAVIGDGRIEHRDVYCVLENPRVTIYRGQPDHELMQNFDHAISPVYQVDGKGPPVVPTGSVLVRIAESSHIEEFREELDSAGYQLDSALAYAPHAGWAIAKTGKLLDAITSLENLRKNEGVVHCELQMVQPSEKK